MIHHGDIALSFVEEIMSNRKVSPTTANLYALAKRKGMKYLPLCNAVGSDGACQGHEASKRREKQLGRLECSA